jgi:crotonobetainyl-CoA:carnitine CoA-transferase CaiB-like acyl-CoA transferase
MMNENGAPGREPLYGVGHRSQYAAGVGAYLSVLAALYARRATGQGQQVALDVAMNTASMAPPATADFAYSGMQESRGENRRPFMVVRCQDGWVSVWVHPHAWAAFCQAAAIPELEADPRFARPKERVENWEALTACVQEQVRGMSGDEFLERLLAGRVPGPRRIRPQLWWHGAPARQRYWHRRRGRGPADWAHSSHGRTPNRVSRGARVWGMNRHRRRRIGPRVWRALRPWRRRLASWPRRFPRSPPPRAARARQAGADR